MVFIDYQIKISISYQIKLPKLYPVNINNNQSSYKIIRKESYNKYCKKIKFNNRNKVKNKNLIIRK